MSINRCICHNLTFSEILKISRENAFTTVEELQENEICSTNCKLCKPYIVRMLKTGKVEFEPNEFYNITK